MGERILVVDDDPQYPELLGTSLREWGYESFIAHDGFEALVRLTEHLPDLVISDLQMPRMSGFELLGVLRHRYPEIPVVCISSEYEALAAPPYVICDALFNKGACDYHELRAKIAELLRGKHRDSLLKGLQPMVWLPRGRDDYYIVTCTNCLRSFPVRGTTELENSEQHATCIHCKTVLNYFIEGVRR